MTGDNNEEAAGARFEFNKDFLFLVTLLGSVLAVTYDVGYFSRIDLRLFTFFSLNEHIVFALSVLPAALVAAALWGGGLIYFALPSKTAFRKIDRATKKTGLFFLLPVLCTLVLVIWLLDDTLSPSAAILAVAGSVIAFIGLELKRLPERLIFGCVAATLFALVIGYIAASSYLQPTAFQRIGLTGQPQTMTIETEEGILDVKWMRSGERGILFFDNNTKAISLLRWDHIRRININAQP